MSEIEYSEEENMNIGNMFSEEKSPKLEKNNKLSLSPEMEKSEPKINESKIIESPRYEKENNLMLKIPK